MTTIISREQAGLLEDRAVAEIAVPQWARLRDDGSIEQRGVKVKAWSFAQRQRAEQAALIRQGPDAGQVNDWIRIAEEVRLAIIEPPDLPRETIEGWGYGVVEFIHSQIERLAPIPAALLSAELARLAGGPPPEPDGAPPSGSA